MTVATLTNRISYPGAGLTGPFAFPFRILSTADLLVTKRDSADVETTLSYATGWTMTTGFSVGDATGSITLVTALAVGETLVVRRAPSLIQPTSIQNQGSYFPKTHEDEFDRLVMQLQSVQDQVDRAVGVLESYDPAVMLLRLKPETGKVLAWQSATELGNSALDSGAIAVPGGGRTVASLSAYLLNNATYNVKDFGAVGNATSVGAGTDDTAAFQAAIDAAYAAHIQTVFVPDGRYTILGTIHMKRGVTLRGAGLSGEYENGIPADMAFGATLIKPSTGTAGPIVETLYANSVGFLELKHLKSGGATTGIVQIGLTGLAIDCVYCVLAHVRIVGLRTNATDGSTTCYGIFFPESQTGNARYYNKLVDVTVTECDVGVRLSGQSNANNVTNLTVRECHVHVELDGGASLCIENVFTGLAAFCQTVLVPAPIVFRLKNNANKNIIVGFVSEAFGTTYSVDDTCTGNVFLGGENNSASHVNGNTNLLNTPITNAAKRSEMLIPSKASTEVDRLVFGRGNGVTFRDIITGTLPATNRPAGTLAAADANVKKIISFGAQYTKASLISLAGRLKVFAYGPGNAGMHVVDVEFFVRNTNFTTGACELDVLRVSSKGGRITGLHFLTGVNAVGAFGIALVGGGSGAATPFDAITVRLDIDAVTFSTNTLQMDLLATQASFAAAALSANDVLDGISLLTVADTAF